MCSVRERQLKIINEVDTTVESPSLVLCIVTRVYLRDPRQKGKDSAVKLLIGGLICFIAQRRCTNISIDRVALRSCQELRCLVAHRCQKIGK
jgi:hypothetical protein